MANNRKSNSNRTNNNKKREQPRKDSRDKRVNYDNTRESKFEKDVQEERHSRKGYDKPMKGAKFGSCASNDVSWYAHTPELLRAAASVPFTDVVGDPLPGVSASGVYASFPGVMAIRWNPYIEGEAVNQSANSHYSFTVHANSRNYQYDAPDQMLMILAGAQLFTAIAMGIRAYGTMRNYDQLDRYTPAALVQAMGFNYSDLKQNLSNMWFDLNEMISRSSQIWIPKDMPVIERWFWMSSHIYRDADSAKAQYYLYVPETLLTLQTKTSSQGTALTPLTWAPNTTWAQYKTLINTMFDNLLNSQDRGIIFGDLLAAYGADRIYGISGIDSSYTVTPVHDIEVLTQIENSVAVPVFIDGVYQSVDDNRIYTKFGGWPVAEANIPSLYQAILNFHQKTAPTPEQIMVATRMMALGIEVAETAVAPSTDVNMKPATCGTEFVVNYEVYFNTWKDWAPTLAQFDLASVRLHTSGPITMTDAMVAWTTFDWAPFLYEVLNSGVAETLNTNKVGSVGSYNAAHEMGDVDMYTHINRLTLQKMHTTAIYSEFGVPTLL